MKEIKERITLYIEKDLRSQVHELTKLYPITSNTLLINLIQYALPYAQKHGPGFLTLDTKSQQSLIKGKK